MARGDPRFPDMTRAYSEVVTQVHEPSGRLRGFELLGEMPFSSELKRMGVLLRDESTGAIQFLAKGAESVMAERVASSDWMEEEVGNLAREGLRTLVVAARGLSAPPLAAEETTAVCTGACAPRTLGARPLGAAARCLLARVRRGAVRGRGRPRGLRVKLPGSRRRGAARSGGARRGDPRGVGDAAGGHAAALRDGRRGPAAGESRHTSADRCDLCCSA